MAARRAKREWHLTLEAPARLGPPPPRPVLDAFPRAVREVFEAMDAAQAVSFRPDQQLGHHVIGGTPGGPGVAEGPARVVFGVDDFGRVQAGDVVVCPTTSPAWTLIFPRIAALVTDGGGALSHPAVVAREYGLPSVVGTLNATRLIRDGQRLRVDGNEGRVTLL